MRNINRQKEIAYINKLRIYICLVVDPAWDFRSMCQHWFDRLHDYQLELIAGSDYVGKYAAFELFERKALGKQRIQLDRHIVDKWWVEEYSNRGFCKKDLRRINKGWEGRWPKRKSKSL